MGCYGIGISRLAQVDITTLCGQILHWNLSEDWKCKCDSHYALKKYSEDYFKEHEVYPIITG